MSEVDFKALERPLRRRAVGSTYSVAGWAANRMTRHSRTGPQAFHPPPRPAGRDGVAHMPPARARRGPSVDDGHLAPVEALQAAAGAEAAPHRGQRALVAAGNQPRLSTHAQEAQVVFFQAEDGIRDGGVGDVGEYRLAAAEVDRIDAAAA